MSEKTTESNSLEEFVEQYKSVKKYRTIIFFIMIVMITMSTTLIVILLSIPGAAMPLVILGSLPGILAIGLFVFMQTFLMKFGGLLAKYLVMAKIPENEVESIVKELKLNPKLLEKARKSGDRE